MKESWIVPEYTFDGFVVGPHNSACVSAAMDIVEHAFAAGNPFYVYGGEGLGKTHLLHAIVNAFIEKGWTNGVCQSAERFVSAHKLAKRDGKVREFRGRYQNLDVFAISEIQFVASRPDHRRELVEICDALYENGKPILLDSSVPPEDIPELAERMVSRYASRRVIEMKPPELETRLMILAEKARSQGVVLDEEVAFYLASRFTDCTRALEGELRRLLAYARLANRPIDLELAKKSVVRDFSPDHGWIH